ncbi:hypothetical protein HA51_00585 [Pantoea rwandensis]|uniref:Uncharacterized protein n=1 Tax=Pantoea rwandensis TaxID=1076550 RepID=A0A1X1D528_9GAMM|nr:hypothetical protein HA51_00585 [Pantoea rwandensis]
MGNLIKGLCVFFGIMVGNLFLNGACVGNGEYAAPAELSRLMVTILTWWGTMSVFLKITSFIIGRKRRTK